MVKPGATLLSVSTIMMHVDKQDPGNSLYTVGNAINFSRRDLRCMYRIVAQVQHDTTARPIHPLLPVGCTIPRNTIRIGRYIWGLGRCGIVYYPTLHEFLEVDRRSYCESFCDMVDMDAARVSQKLSETTHITQLDCVSNDAIGSSL